MKIGIMGGTFNPIHNAHLMMAQAAYEQYKLDEIWFMPSAKPPHKNQDEIAEKDIENVWFNLRLTNPVF